MRARGGRENCAVALSVTGFLARAEDFSGEVWSRGTTVSTESRNKNPAEFQSIVPVEKGRGASDSAQRMKPKC